MPLAFAFLVVLAWDFRCKRKRWRRRKIEYVWAFVDGGISYVMAAIVIAHNGYDMKFSDILATGFGDTQVNLAFIGALFEAIWSLWDMWNGDGVMPSPHA